MSVVKGNRFIYLYRLLDDAATTDATGIAYTTENSRSISADSDSTTTKDGTVVTPKDPETTIKCTALYSSEGSPMIKKMETAITNHKMVELWEINMDAPGTDTNASKYEANYFHAYVTSHELTSNAEDFAEASVEFKVDGSGASGYATLSSTQETVASLVFKDTTKTGA